MVVGQRRRAADAIVRIYVVIDKDFLLRALLQYNYLPFQREAKEEMPPLLSSEKFTPDIARELIKYESQNGRKRKTGYDWMEYRATRFSNVSRSLAIPHPLGYAALALTFYQYWDKIHPKIYSKNSLVAPKSHPDGRIIVMDYEKGARRAFRELRNRFGKRFIVQADIANFYPSIYSHSIPWALVGFMQGKQAHEGDWFYEIDRRTQLLKRKETNGVPIGPATSNLIAETLLARVDEDLRKKGFEFVRFIDDYVGVFATYDEAEDFLLSLSKSLGKYKLFLNERKTVISPLPTPLSTEWIADLNTRQPRPLETSVQAVRFLDYAIHKQKQTPQGSVLKYAVKSILAEAKGEVAHAVLLYVLNLSMYYPVVIPLINPLLDKLQITTFPYTEEINFLLSTHVRYQRSDAVSWLLYYVFKHHVSLPEKLAHDLIQTKDCLPILMLYYASPENQTLVVNFANRLVKTKTSIYDLDACWLLLYQLFYEDKIRNPYKGFHKDAEAFDYLKSQGVSFLAPS